MVVPLRGPRYGGRPRTLSHFALGQDDDTDYLNTDYLSAPVNTGSFAVNVAAPSINSSSFDYTQANSVAPIIPGISTAGNPTFASGVTPSPAIAPILPTTGSSVSAAGIGPTLSEAAQGVSALTNIVQQLTSAATPTRATPCTTPTGAAGTVSGSTCVATPVSALTASTIIPGVPDVVIYGGVALLGIGAVLALGKK